DAGFKCLHLIAGFRYQGHHSTVCQAGYLYFALPYAHRFNKDKIEGCIFYKIRNLYYFSIKSAEGAPCGERTYKNIGMRIKFVHAYPVPQQCTIVERDRK